MLSKNVLLLTFPRASNLSCIIRDAINTIRDFFRPSAPASTSTSPHPSISMTQDGRNVTIDAVFRFTGNASGSDSFVPGSSSVTFRQAFMDGVAWHWGGTNRGGLDVTVNVFDWDYTQFLSKGVQSYLNVELRDGPGLSIHFGWRNWSVANPGNIVMYTQFWEGHLRTVKTKPSENLGPHRHTNLVMRWASTMPLDLVRPAGDLQRQSSVATTTLYLHVLTDL